MSDALDEYENRCTVCGVWLGDSNPRQYCQKTWCDGECLKCGQYYCTGLCMSSDATQSKIIKKSAGDATGPDAAASDAAGGARLASTAEQPSTNTGDDDAGDDAVIAVIDASTSPGCGWADRFSHLLISRSMK